MDELTQWAVDALNTDPVISLLLTGRAWGQPIVPEPDGDEGGALTPDGWYFATPEAFDENPPFLIKPCISVNRMPRTPHPGNWIGKIADYLEVWYYCKQTEADQLIANQIMLLVREKFNRKYVAYDQSGGIIEPANDMLPLKPTVEFPQAVSGLERFRINV